MSPDEYRTDDIQRDKERMWNQEAAQDAWEESQEPLTEDEKREARYDEAEEAQRELETALDTIMEIINRYEQTDADEAAELIATGEIDEQN